MTEVQVVPVAAALAVVAVQAVAGGPTEEATVSVVTVSSAVRTPAVVTGVTLQAVMTL
ncbi:hypothetical protein [Salinibacter sp. 10B]|uniref:hypothetical protein n=1 Tax=Salinibacter sp. 10B TaxID=1923971 RepID=UPI0015E2D875|nr:hypothetical protein [Salinibacter sp. 10B]